MTMTNDEINTDLIEQLREMTEEIDFNQFLKKKYGGYTKKSVMDYLSMLRRQQQTASETFYKNLQILYTEKEEIQNTNKKLIARLQKLESEYKNLSEAIQMYHPENQELALSNLMSLQNSLSTKEEEVKKILHDKQLLEKKLEHSESSNNELKNKIEQLSKEHVAQKEVMLTIKQELSKKYDSISDLSNQLEVEREENKYLKARASETQVFQLNQKINELTEQLAMQSELIGIKMDETEKKDQIITVLNADLETLKENQDRLYIIIDEINAQNDRLILSNQEFTKALEEEFMNSIAMIKEKSYINRERIEALKKLDESYSRINMLELQLEKGGKVIDLNRVNQQAHKGNEDIAK